jgi:hypothetical protein
MERTERTVDSNFKRHVYVEGNSTHLCFIGRWLLLVTVQDSGSVSVVSPFTETYTHSKQIQANDYQIGSTFLVNKSNLIHNFYSLYISIVYMFRATICSSSGEISVSIRHGYFFWWWANSCPKYVKNRNKERRKIAHQVGFIYKNIEGCTANKTKKNFFFVLLISNNFIYTTLYYPLFWISKKCLLRSIFFIEIKLENFGNYVWIALQVLTYSSGERWGNRLDWLSEKW